MGGLQLLYTSNGEEKVLNSHLLLETLANSVPSLKETLCQMEGLPPQLLALAQPLYINRVLNFDMKSHPVMKKLGKTQS